MTALPSLLDQLRSTGKLEIFEPFTAERIAELEEALGAPVPPDIGVLWRTAGCCGLGMASFYDAYLVLDLLEQYADEGLRGLIPLASDGGSRDFAVDLLGRHRDRVMLVDRGDMTEEYLMPVARDLATLLELLAVDGISTDGPTLGELRAAATRFDPPLAALRPQDVEVLRVDFKTGQPVELRPKGDVEIAGVPCKAGRNVHLVRSRLAHATLSRRCVMDGVELEADTLLTRSLRGLERYTPVHDREIEGMVFAAGAELYDSWNVNEADLRYLRGTLKAPQLLAGVSCAAGPVSLECRAGRWLVKSATLAEAQPVCGVPLPAQSSGQVQRRMHGVKVIASWEELSRNADAGSWWRRPGQRRAGRTRWAWCA
jgi:hypothetical protein